MFPDHQQNEEYMAVISRLSKSNERIFRQNQPLSMFVRGLIYGVGSSLGVIIVFTLLIYLLKLIGVFEYLEPYFNYVK